MAVGLKVTVNFRLPPAATEVLLDKPLTVNPVPLTVACERIRLPFPLFVNETVFAVEDPTSSLPKATLVALAVSVPVGGGFAPLGDPVVVGDFVLPLTGTESVVLPPVLWPMTTSTLPLKLCKAFGANMTWNEVLPPATSCSGVDGLRTTKPGDEL